MVIDPAEASSIQDPQPTRTTGLDSSGSTGLLDASAEDGDSKSPLQHAVEIIVPILAFLAVAIFSAPVAEVCREEIPGTMPTAVLILLRVWIAYMVARFAARWVSR